MRLFRRNRKVAEDFDWTAGRFLCAFCGEGIYEPPVILTLSFPGSAQESAEQWLTSHRKCLVERIADDELFRGGPLFENASGD